MKTLQLTKGQVKDIANEIQKDYRIHSEGRTYVIYDVHNELNSLKSIKVQQDFEKAVDNLVMMKTKMLHKDTTKLYQGFKDWMDVGIKNRIFLSKVRKGVITLLSGHNFG